VDGAIHRAGGPAILEECKNIGGCATGDAVITTAGDMPAGHVIHTVGPVWHGGDGDEPELLASAYRRSLEVADENDLETVAFPSISTGAYGYPIDKAARTALETGINYLEADTGLKLVRFVLFTTKDLDVYSRVLRDLE
jgi:O-acetyl-ADP-ribose deacetylase (regulator of RNase III)